MEAQNSQSTAIPSFLHERKILSTIKFIILVSLKKNSKSFVKSYCDYLLLIVVFSSARRFF